MTAYRNITRIFYAALAMIFFIAPLCPAESDPESLDDLWDSMWDDAQEIVVVTVTTASRTSKTFEEAPSIVSAITRDEFQKMGARTIEDILNFIPGFMIGRSIYSGQHQTINARGRSSYFAEGILFLVNGQRINDGISGGAVTSVPDYPLDNVKQVEIIRGPGSALYGANAFVAVINVITMKASDLDGGILSYRGGTDQGHYAIFEYGKQLQDIVLTLHGSVTNWDAEDLPQRDFTQQGMDTTGVSHVLPYLTFTTNHRYNDRKNSDAVQIYQIGASAGFKGALLEVNYDESDNKNHWGYGARKGYEKYRSIFKTKNVRLGFRYENQVEEKLKLNALAGYFYHEPFARDASVHTFHDDFDAIPDSILVNNWFHEEKKSRTYNSEISVVYQHSEAHTAIFGVNAQRDELNNFVAGNIVSPEDTLPTQSDKDRNYYAMFAQYTWDINQLFSLTSGIRFDYFTRSDSLGNRDGSDSRLIPRYALIVRPDKKWTIKLLYGEAFRAPSLYEMYVEDFGGNTNLKPEKNRTYEAQFNYKPTPQLIFSTAGYIIDIEDFIYYNGEWENVGDYYSEGIELEMRYQPSRNLWAFANYTYIEAERGYWNPVIREIEKRKLEAMPTHFLNFCINIDLFDRLNLNLNGYGRWDWSSQPKISQNLSTEYLESRIPEEYHDVIEDFPEVVWFPETNFPDFTVLNFHAELRDLLPNATLTFSAMNLSDADQIVGDLHNVAPAGISINGRQFLAGVRLNF